MDESRPRDLTPEELALVRSSAAGAAGGTEPLRIPPGTQIAVELLNPAGDRTGIASPTASPPEGGADATAVKAPAAPPSSGKKREK
jgi:hypothetical protein